MLRKGCVELLKISCRYTTVQECKERHRNPEILNEKSTFVYPLKESLKEPENASPLERLDLSSTRFGACECLRAQPTNGSKAVSG